MIERGRDPGDEIVVGHLSGGGDHHAASAVVAGHVAQKALARQLGDDLGAAQHRAAERLARIGDLLEVVENDVVRGVVGLADLLQHDRAFAGQLVRVEHRVLQNVGDDIESERHVVGQHLGVVGGVLAARVGVQVAADRLDLLGDVERRAPLGALEGHVLEQVGDAVDLCRFVAGADVDPGADRHRLHVRH